MSSLARHLLTGLLAAALAAAACWAGIEPLAPTAGQARTAVEMLEKLEARHYAKRAVDDRFSAELLDHYLETLDPGKLYLLAGDVAAFGARWRHRLDDALKQGDLNPAFAIFNRYRERAMARLEKTIALLEGGVQFDFAAREVLDYEAERRAYAATEEELDERWRKRVKDAWLRLLLVDKPEAEIPELLAKRYRNQLKLLEQATAEDVAQYFLNAVATLYDPHTNYYSPHQLENFNISMSLKLEGIGAVLQMEDETVKVVRVIPGGPAARQGILKPGDRIVAVGQGSEGPMEDVVGWRLDDVVDLIRGPKGSTVRLEIVPAQGELAGQHQLLTLVRDEVRLEEQAAKARLLELPDGERTWRIGVIDLPAFYIDFEAFNRRDPDFRSTTRDVAVLLDRLSALGIDGLILDLRDNGGGSLHEVTTMADLFLPPGPVVQVRTADDQVSRRYRSRREPRYRGPLLVLVNRISASASEILAGAVQDYGRGLVVGARTFGKGTVQALVPLREGQLKLTESKFYRVSGDSTQHRGVIPDIELLPLYDPEEVGESAEDRALPWDRIHSVPIQRYGDLSPLLAELRRRHAERVANDPDYRALQEELALEQQLRDRQVVSLNLEERRAEREAYERARMEIENRRRQAKGLAPYATLAEWRAGEEEPEGEEPAAEASGGAPEEAPQAVDPAEDPLLAEAARILVDQVRLVQHGQSPPLRLAGEKVN
ncbi:MAG: peptidase S41 [Porticoccaceae bacterium]|nr:MAG: peptidase S41 [Porticoccaceae bacterium]